MNAQEALDELTELSSQVLAAVIVDGDGTILGSTLADPARSAALAGAGSALVEAASEVRPGGPAVTRVEVGLDAGSLFAVREQARTIVATTVPEPTSGLVLYDLRTALGRIDEPAAAPGGAGEGTSSDA